MAPRDVVDDYLHALSSRDVDRAVALVADDFHNEHVSPLATSSHGRDEYARRLPGFLGQFAGLQYDVADMVSEGDRVAVRYRLTANYHGHPLDIPGVMWFEVRDARIAHRIDVWDSLTFLRQTGAVEERAGGSPGAG